MSRSKPCVVSAFIGILSLGPASSQQSAPVPEGPSALNGSVTGVVSYSETQLPTRFAEIHLVPIPSGADLEPVKDKPIPSGVVQERDRRVQIVSGTSDMTGSFRLDGVPPGDYLVAAVKPGYLTPGGAAAMDWTLSEDQIKSLIASLPQVHVYAGQTASVILTLHRGAVIAGRMQFADGSPVIGVMVECEPFEKIRPAPGAEVSARQGALSFLGSSDNPRSQKLTDDEGRYRIAGLSPGKYVLSTTMLLDHSSATVIRNDGSSSHAEGRERVLPETIEVYGPGTFRRKEAKIFEVRGDEQVTHADLTIDPNGLHYLRGKVLAAEDHHAPTTLVRLKEDGAKDFGRFVQSGDDGTFQFNYLPSGSYALEIYSSDDPKVADSAELPTQYKVFKLNAVVADHDSVLDDVLVMPLKPGEKNPASSFE